MTTRKQCISLIVSLTCALLILVLPTRGQADTVKQPALQETPLNASPWQDDYTHWLFIAWSNCGPVPPGTIEKSEKGQRVVSRQRRVLPLGTTLGAQYEESPGAWYERIGELFTDMTSTYLAYNAYRAHAWYLVFNGQEWGPYADEASMVTFSQDGKRLAYLIRDGDGNIPFVDGHPGTKTYNVTDLFFSEDSKHIAFRVRSDWMWWHYVIDGNAQPDYIAVSGLLFSPDGKHYAYIAKHDEGQFGVIHDGKAMTIYDDIGDFRYTNDSPLLFSPDSSSLAYAAISHGYSFVVLNGTPLRQFPLTTTRPHETHHWISDLVFSADSRSLAYRATDERFVTQENPEDHTLVEERIPGTYDLIVTPNATLIMPENYQRTSLALSPHGKHVAVVAGVTGKQSVYVDGKSGPYYAEILSIRNAGNQPNGYIRFSAEETFHYFAQKKNTMTLVVEETLPHAR